MLRKAEQMQRSQNRKRCVNRLWYFRQREFLKSPLSGLQKYQILQKFDAIRENLRLFVQEQRLNLWYDANLKHGRFLDKHEISTDQKWIEISNRELVDRYIIKDKEISVLSQINAHPLSECEFDMTKFYDDLAVADVDFC